MIHLCQSLAGDASAYSIGAVISNTLKDGSERSMSFASCTHNKQANLYSVGKRGIIPDLWCQEVSPATAWEKVYTGD